MKKHEVSVNLFYETSCFMLKKEKRESFMKQGKESSNSESVPTPDRVGFQRNIAAHRTCALGEPCDGLYFLSAGGAWTDKGAVGFCQRQYRDADNPMTAAAACGTE